ncbi:hypothetical protein [Streptomyces sp. NPDC059247]|uniref:hypothetical protein n=1 Tax=Streptomyces sp. NPDC059247 TaxID=3346790 RepID=UPI0036C27719
MPALPSPAIAAAGLVGGYAVARWSGKRAFGGVVLVGAGGVAAYEWRRVGGAKVAAGLGAVYLAGFAGSHPLARKIGAWPAVFSAAGAVAAASWAVTRDKG